MNASDLLDPDKMKEIASKALKRFPHAIKRLGEDNQAELNNLGHEIVTEDFSDSPFADKDIKL